MKCGSRRSHKLRGCPIMCMLFLFPLGIDCATSQYACIWCKCPVQDRFNPDKVWSLTNPSQGARSIEENVQLSEKPGKKKFNVSRRPLFTTIPLTNVVIDNLHLFLRVADVLINLLIMELRRQDCIEKQRVFSEFNHVKYKHCAAFERFVCSLGIPGYSFYIGRTSKQLKARTLTGPEKLKVFSHINMAQLLPALRPDQVTKLQHLWGELLQLNRLFSKRPEELSNGNIVEFEHKAREWGRRFIEVYHASNVTPYIHALMNHVPEFLKLHGGILQFTQHGLEKYNDVMMKQYFRATNHRGQQALLQIMQKQNRLEHLRDNNMQTEKCFSITCSNCRGTGHNRLSCCKPCVTCGYTPFRAHLIEIGQKKAPSCAQEN